MKTDISNFARKLLSVTYLIVLSSCGTVDNEESPPQQPDGSPFGLEAEPPHIGSDRKRSFPLVHCLGEVRKKNSHIILSDLTALARHEDGTPVELPGHSDAGPSESDATDYYVTRRYSLAELREKCERGLRTRFEHAAKVEPEQFGESSEDLLRDFEPGSRVHAFIKGSDGKSLEIIEGLKNP